MKALSFRAPWSWAVTDLPVPTAKTLENRVWRTLKNGLSDKMLPLHTDFAIHTSKTSPFDFDIDGVLEATGLDVLPPEAALRSAITGVAQVHMVLRCVESMALTDGSLEERMFPRYQLRPSDRDQYLYDLNLPATTAERHDQLKRWWLGPYALVLKKVRKLRNPVLEVKGALNFWQVPAKVEDRVREQLDD